MKKSIALISIFAAGTLFLVGCSKKWEYKQAHSIEEVNKAAADGWEVVSLSVCVARAYPSDSDKATTKYDNEDIYLLKRPKN